MPALCSTALRQDGTRVSPASRQNMRQESGTSSPTASTHARYGRIRTTLVRDPQWTAMVSRQLPVALLPVHLCVRLPLRRKPDVSRRRNNSQMSVMLTTSPEWNLSTNLRIAMHLVAVAFDHGCARAHRSPAS